MVATRRLRARTPSREFSWIDRSRRVNLAASSIFISGRRLLSLNDRRHPLKGDALAGSLRRRDSRFAIPTQREYASVKSNSSGVHGYTGDMSSLPCHRWMILHAGNIRGYPLGCLFRARPENRHNGGSREPLDFPISSTNERDASLARRARRQWDDRHRRPTMEATLPVGASVPPEVQANVFDQDDPAEPDR